MTTTTSNEGVYAVSNPSPGPYRPQVSKPGFKALIKPDIAPEVETRCAGVCRQLEEASGVQKVSELA